MFQRQHPTQAALELSSPALDEESILMRRIANGEEGAVEEIVDRWAPTLCAFTDGLRIDPRVADTAIDEVFRRVMFEAPRFVARPERLSEWLRETVRNCVAATIARNSIAGPRHEVRMVESEACLALVREQRVAEAMRYMNSLTPFRFTGIYRFDGMSVANVHLFDRQCGFGSDGSVAPVSSTFCLWINESLSVVQMTDSMTDPRAFGHPKREVVRSYCGGPICGEEGELVGTICHFDYEPRDIPAGLLAMLDAIGPSLHSIVAADPA